MWAEYGSKDREGLDDIDLDLCDYYQPERMQDLSLGEGDEDGNTRENLVDGKEMRDGGKRDERE